MSIFVNEIEIDSFTFPGGERNVKLPVSLGLETRNFSVYTLIKSSDDIIDLLLTISAIREAAPVSPKISLYIPYFPFARQDRVCSDGEALGAKVMASLINSLNLESVQVIDPHSDVVPALLNNCRIVTRAEIVERILTKHLGVSNLTIVCPDAGAVKETNKIRDRFYSNVLYCRKERSFETKKVSVHIDESFNISGESFLIIDDICDGGATFSEIARKLKEQGAVEVLLYVTHGIFSSNGLLKLKDSGVDHVYCMTNFQKICSDFLTEMGEYK